MLFHALTGELPFKPTSSPKTAPRYLSKQDRESWDKYEAMAALQDSWVSFLGLARSHNGQHHVLLCRVATIWTCTCTSMAFCCSTNVQYPCGFYSRNALCHQDAVVIPDDSSEVILKSGTAAASVGAAPLLLPCSALLIRAFINQQLWPSPSLLQHEFEQ